ncbi:hypothetical protein A2230_00455 [candidate division WOR-1 bacterium RIFOXYA2_FULL_36_21]|uniref:Undecaprenyl-phosphate alpha-N-acetylglucosaminyl 1-phosphate transferase n=1 Tax=candidate division WOR-1 bacterium RIFOXYB2_FULL_36_35 TaxID=1802578 RepID=A0A1F4S5G2_UNCSA|nr:MAG: hypothetical protein A2230_00455 [candidate division WOR-1 bacterium RIFOXYA2_FULL_36_21]OGC15639.1 MAG: hypothetical protein A2290_06155 [candidate division WOR-1 bacterium RIFOXYB2_FULL_36_35]OGC16387.1 MAG: hypothetical protein A2282_00500 [candidate division WOR-1 bacterium RIFOXYA12_FULL_36_13]
MMLKYIISFLIAFISSLLLVPVIKFLAYKFNVLDHPGFRKIHQHPVPLMGGFVVFPSFLLANWFGREALPGQFWNISIIGCFLIFFGLFDDAGIKIKARYKIWTHLAFSFLLIYLTGMSFDFFRLDLINIVITACFITFMTNSMNMLDGMDGLVSGLSFFMFIFFGFLALNSGQLGLLTIAASGMGATLGFLKYNFASASIFLGESGSTWLGFILAVFAININLYDLWKIAIPLGIERLQLISFFIPLIILGIPIFDTYFVFANRFFHRIKFSQPGKDHSHHRIHLMGFSHRDTVLSLYAIQIILGAIALSMVRANLQQFIALSMIVVVFFVGFTFFLTRIKVYS